MKSFDVAVIGGGVVGTSIFSLLSRNGVKVALFEKEEDVASFASKANSGIIHAGYDPIPGTNMAKFNVLGSKMYEKMCKRLGVKFLKTGTLVVSEKDGKKQLEILLKRGEENGVKDLTILGKKELEKLEPNLADNIEFGLFAKSGGIVGPYEVCVALAEEGIVNGGKVFLNCPVEKIKKQGNIFILGDKNEKFGAKYVINCAGENSNKINELVKAKTFNMNYVKGEYILLDKSEKDFVARPIFPLPTEKGKGILANISVHGNVLFGPTATVCEKTDTSVSLEGINKIKTDVLKTVKNPNFKKTIKLFAGVRVKAEKDFEIDRDEKIKNYYYAVGICSPGLSAAPAIAEHFLKLLKVDGLKTKKIENKKRIPYTNTQEMSKSKLNALIKINPAYGRVVCRCENISEGEILEVLNSPLKPQSIDAIKRRVRPSMGRCQGSFCVPKLLKLISKTKKIKMEEITQKGKGSELLFGDIKQGAKL